MTANVVRVADVDYSERSGRSGGGLFEFFSEGFARYVGERGEANVAGHVGFDCKESVCVYWGGAGAKRGTKVNEGEVKDKNVRFLVGFGIGSRALLNPWLRDL